MSFRLRKNLLARRKQRITEGIEAAAKWPKAARDEYLNLPRHALVHAPEILDEFRFDMIKAQKAKALMGRMGYERQLSQ